MRIGAHWRQVDERLGSGAPPLLLSVSQTADDQPFLHQLEIGERVSRLFTIHGVVGV